MFKRRSRGPGKDLCVHQVCRRLGLGASGCVLPIVGPLPSYVVLCV